jgi:hypothetical protein
MIYVTLLNESAYTAHTVLVPTTRGVSLTVAEGVTLPRARQSILPPSGANAKVILIGSESTAEVLGVPNDAFRTDDGFVGTSSTSPTRIWYYNLLI